MSEYENKFWSTWVNNYWQVVTFSLPDGWYTHVRHSDGKEDHYFPILEAKTALKAKANHEKHCSTSSMDTTAAENVRYSGGKKLAMRGKTFKGGRNGNYRPHPRDP